MLGIDGFRVLDVHHCGQLLHIVVESVNPPAWCPGCREPLIGHGRDVVELVDAPWAGRPVRLVWRKRRFLCVNQDCGTTTASEVDARLAQPRARLTTRAIKWAIKQFRRENDSVLGLARQLGVNWDTVWDAIKPLLIAADNDLSRFDGVTALGVDEHTRHHGDQRKYGQRMLTGMVDLTPGSDGKPHARLLDLVEGRSGGVYKQWLTDRGQVFTSKVKVATLDPFHGYKNAIDDELQDAVAVLDRFHVQALATKMVDEVRCRVQLETLGHRGRKGDPLYGIRNILRANENNLTDRQFSRLANALGENETYEEVYWAWRVAQDLTAAYDAPNPKKGRDLARRLLHWLKTCPIPEAKRLGTTLRRWRDAFLAYWTERGASNGGSEAINGLIELHRRIARGIPNLTNYRLRMLLIAGGFDTVIKW